MTITRLDLTAYYYRFELMVYESSEMPYQSVTVYRGESAVSVNVHDTGSLMVKGVNRVPKPLLNACIAFADTPVDDRKYKSYRPIRLQGARQRIKKERY